MYRLTYKTYKMNNDLITFLREQQVKQKINETKLNNSYNEKKKRQTKNR